MDKLNLIKRFEGCVPHLYYDVVNIATIGYGHVINDTDNYRGGITGKQLKSLARRNLRAAQTLVNLSEKEAELWLNNDASRAERAIARYIDVPLSEGQYASLLSFTFNTGTGALQRSTLRRKINRGEHCAIPEELMRWVFAGGRKIPGLIRRRKAEGECYSERNPSL